MREICLDTETTGLDPKDGDRIIEIACIEIFNKVKTGNHFHTYINPEIEVPLEAFKIHGIATKFLQDKPKFNQIAADFINFIGESTLVIHNAGFDMKFINHHLRGCNFEIIERSRVIDSLEIARKKFPGAGNSLDALCRRFGVDLSKRTKHGAMIDAELLADRYIELMGGSQISMFENASPIQNNSNILESIIINTNNFRKRTLPLSAEELGNHKKFILDNFKDNLWGYNKNS